VCDYVHLNPTRAKLLPEDASPRDYQWSSFNLVIAMPSRRPNWLRVDRLLGEYGIPQDSTTGRRQFEQRFEARRAQESGEEFRAVRSGWCFGDDQFRKELLAQVEGGAGQYHYGAEIQEAGEAKASRIIDEELRRSIWTEAELALRKKGDPVKVRIARRLRAETTVTLQWIAARLHMGAKTHLSHLLYWTGREEKKAGISVSAEQKRRNRASVAEQWRLRQDPGELQERVDQSQVAKVSTSAGDGTIPLTDPSGVGGFDTRFD